MKYSLKIGIISTFIFSAFFFVGLSGCAAQDISISPQKYVAFTDQKLQDSTKNNIHDPYYKLNARNIFVYLIFNRALLHRDPKGVLVTFKELMQYPLPEFVFLDMGVFALGNGHKDFLVFLEKGIKLYPKSTSLHMLYAELLQKNGRNSAAIAHIKKFITENPQNNDGKIELALLLINAKNYLEAEKIFLSLDPKERNGYVDYYYSKALQGLNRKAEAMRYLELSVQKTPNFTDALNDLAFLYEQQNQLEKSMAIYEKMLTGYAASSEVAVRLIMLSLKLKQPERALRYFEDFPMTASLSVTVASLFVDAGYNDIAENILLALLDVQEAPQELYFYLAAIAYERDKDLKKAHKWLTNIQKGNKAYPRALLLRMQLLMDLQQLDQALLESREGKFSLPEDPEFWLAEIRILATQGKINEAINNVNIIFSKWPDNIEIAYLRASLFDRNGQKKSAFMAMEDIIKKDPNHFYALNYVGYTLAEENRQIKRAVTLLRKAVELSPKSNFILDSLAWALFKAKEMEEAWDIINAAINVSPVHDPAIWEHYAEIARALGKRKEARYGYRKALEFLPENAQNIQQKLNQL